MSITQNYVSARNSYYKQLALWALLIDMDVRSSATDMPIASAQLLKSRILLAQGKKETLYSLMEEAKFHCRLEGYSFCESCDLGSWEIFDLGNEGCCSKPLFI